MLHLAAPARRLAPEALTFAVRLLRCAAPGAPAPPAGGAGGAAPANAPASAAAEPDPAGPPPEHKWLLPEGGWRRAGQGAGAAVPPLDVRIALGGGPDSAEAYFGSDGFRASALAAALGLARRAGEVFGGAPALPELLAPACAALCALGGAGLPQARARARAAWSEGLPLRPRPLCCTGRRRSIEKRRMTVVTRRAACTHAMPPDWRAALLILEEPWPWRKSRRVDVRPGWTSDQGQLIMVRSC